MVGSEGAYCVLFSLRLLFALSYSFPFSRLRRVVCFHFRYIRVGCGRSMCWFVFSLSLGSFSFFSFFFVFLFVCFSVLACVRSGGARVCVVRGCIRIGFELLFIP